MGYFSKAGEAEVGTAVKGELNYLRRSGQRPVAYTFEPPPGVPRYSGELDTRLVPIHNARQEEDVGLNRSGFELVRHRSVLSQFDDYQDEARVRDIYYPEVQSVIRAVTGAEKVVVFDHTLRDSTPEHGRDGVREPVRRVHDDQTFDSAPRRVPRHLPPQEAALRLQRRFAIINFWRPIGSTVQQSPLALCDGRSIEQQDFVPSDLVYPDWTGETYSFTYNANHRWYWYPQQQTDEVVLIKVYDSLTSGVARLSAHTSFEDPQAPVDAPPRRSIEVRSLVFW
jgi:hypothetical protein